MTFHWSSPPPGLTVIAGASAASRSTSEQVASGTSDAADVRAGGAGRRQGSYRVAAPCTRSRCRRTTARRNPLRGGGRRWAARPVPTIARRTRRTARRGRSPCPRRSPGTAAVRLVDMAASIPIRRCRAEDGAGLDRAALLRLSCAQADDHPTRRLALLALPAPQRLSRQGALSCRQARRRRARRGERPPCSRSAVIPKGTTHEVLEERPRRRRQGEQGSWTSSVVWKGPLKEDDLKSQIDIVEEHDHPGRCRGIVAGAPSTTRRSRSAP